MGISSPTINFPVDETIKRIEYVKANAMGIIHEAKKIQREVSAIRSETDADEKERIDAADGKLGDILIRFLQKSFPKDGIICEDKPTIDGGDFKWILDPVDGSMNFVRGLPLYAISFGLEHRETPVGGVVIVPPQESVYSAVMGEGAYKNGEPIVTSRISELNRAIFFAKPSNKTSPYDPRDYGRPFRFFNLCTFFSKDWFLCSRCMFYSRRCDGCYLGKDSQTLGCFGHFGDFNRSRWETDRFKWSPLLYRTS